MNAACYQSVVIWPFELGIFAVLPRHVFWWISCFFACAYFLHFYFFVVQLFLCTHAHSHLGPTPPAMCGCLQISTPPRRFSITTIAIMTPTATRICWTFIPIRAPDRTPTISGCTRDRLCHRRGPLLFRSRCSRRHSESGHHSLCHIFEIKHSSLLIFNNLACGHSLWFLEVVKKFTFGQILCGWWTQLQSCCS